MMTTQHILENDHFLFSCQVINGLNSFYGIPVKVPKISDDGYFFNNDIRWGIATISYLFRKDFIKIFEQLKKSLKNEEQFQKYCMLISVSKNDRYFFNFLRRVALIYEMAAYCYRKGSNYFVKAQRCIAWYPDKVYFLSAGSWSSLNKTASFLRELGNPFLLVILEESSFRHPLRFSDTVERIEKRLEKKADIEVLNSREMTFLIQQKRKFVARSRDEKLSADSHTEQERAFSQCLKSISCTASMDTPNKERTRIERHSIMEYLRSLLASEVSNKFHMEKLSPSERKYSNATDSFKPFHKHFLSNSGGQSTGYRFDKTHFDFKFQSLQKKHDDKRIKAKNETINSKFIEGDLLSAGLSYSGEISQSRELISSKSQLFSQYIDSLSNETNSLEIPKVEFISKCSPEDKITQQYSNGNNHLENWENSQNSCSSYSSTKSSTLEILSSSRKEELLKKLLEEGHYNQYLRASINVPLGQFIVNDYKRGKNNHIIGKKVLNPQFMINLGSMTGTYDEASNILHISVKRDFPTEAKINSNKSESNSNTNTNIDCSLLNSQTQQQDGKKNKQKKKSKRK